MRRIVTTLLLPLFVAGIIGVGMYAIASQPGQHGEGHSGSMWLSDEIAAKVQLTISNADNGVVISLTSSDADVVKKLQDQFAEVSKLSSSAQLRRLVGGNCDHQEGSEKCKAAHEAGECKDHGSENHETQQDPQQ